jgi:uncharacterized protein YecT (DUF1311 family)
MKSRLVLLLAIFFIVAPQAYAANVRSPLISNSHRWPPVTDSESAVVNNWLGQHAGFDCAKAVTPVEKMICSDDRLSELDGSMGLLYKKVMEKSPAPDDEKERQRTWIQEWRNSCKNSSCLKKAYTQRISELEKDWKNIPFKPSLDKPLLSFAALPPTLEDPAIPNREPLELIGRIEFNHDAAGGKYDISSGKTFYTIRYVWDMTDDQKDILEKLQEASQYIILRGSLVKYKDGTKDIDPHSVVKIFGQSP